LRCVALARAVGPAYSQNILTILVRHKEARHMARKQDADEVSVTEFKARCTALMAQVAETGRKLVVMKHGKPLVEVTPAVGDHPTPFLGRLTGQVTILGDIVAPLDLEWEADADD
jgi:prevent-host-death family protein